MWPTVVKSVTLIPLPFPSLPLPSPTVVKSVTLIPIITSDVMRPKGGISGHIIKKKRHVRNAIHFAGHIDNPIYGVT